MRFIFGVVVGVFLTIGVAYVHDQTITGAPTEREARTLVNWDAFNSQIRGLNETVSAGWTRLTEALPRRS